MSNDSNGTFVGITATILIVGTIIYYVCLAIIDFIKEAVLPFIYSNWLWFAGVGIIVMAIIAYFINIKYIQPWQEKRRLERERQKALARAFNKKQQWAESEAGQHEQMLKDNKIHAEDRILQLQKLSEKNEVYIKEYQDHLAKVKNDKGLWVYLEHRLESLNRIKEKRALAVNEYEEGILRIEVQFTELKRAKENFFEKETDPDFDLEKAQGFFSHMGASFENIEKHLFDEYKENEFAEDEYFNTNQDWLVFDLVQLKETVQHRLMIRNDELEKFV